MNYQENVILYTIKSIHLLNLFICINKIETKNKYNF